MKKIIFSAFILFLLCSCGNYEQQDEVPSDLGKQGPLTYPEDDSLVYPPDTIVVKLPYDSGLVENNLREGLWNVYSEDTSIKGMHSCLDLGHGRKTFPMTMSSILVKETGKYLKGEKEGRWITYEANPPTLPYKWMRTKAIDYKSGKKDGAEIYYERNSYDTSQQITHGVLYWKSGIGI